jgi:hypothetical protein
VVLAGEPSEAVDAPAPSRPSGAATSARSEQSSLEACRPAAAVSKGSENGVEAADKKDEGSSSDSSEYEYEYESESAVASSSAASSSSEYCTTSDDELRDPNALVEMSLRDTGADECKSNVRATSARTPPSDSPKPEEPAEEPETGSPGTGHDFSDAVDVMRRLHSQGLITDIDLRTCLEKHTSFVERKLDTAAEAMLAQMEEANEALEEKGAFSMSPAPRPAARSPSPSGSRSSHDLKPSLYDYEPDVGESRATRAKAPLRIIGVWQKHASSDGREYWYNSRTDESSWAFPAELTDRLNELSTVSPVRSGDGEKKRGILGRARAAMIRRREKRKVKKERGKTTRERERVRASSRA